MIIKNIGNNINKRGKKCVVPISDIGTTHFFENINTFHSPCFNISFIPFDCFYTKKIWENFGFDFFPLIPFLRIV